MGEEGIECNEGKLISKNGGYSPVKQLDNGDLTRSDSQKKIGKRTTYDIAFYSDNIDQR